MNTLEHEQIGNGVKLQKSRNPYIIQNGNVTHLTLMSLENGIPQPINQLQLTLGEMVAMPDYFTDPTWNVELNLEPCHQYNTNAHLGKSLIRADVSDIEKSAYLRAFDDLANPQRSRSSVDTVFSIARTTYFPVDSVNNLIKELLRFWKVKHYDKKLDKNQTHFTPWSVRVYIIGHTMALDYAEIAYLLNCRANNPNFHADNSHFHNVLGHLNSNDQLNKAMLEEYAHRFHAMSIAIEMYTGHYLSDHFAAGHMSQVGDLRVEMPNRYGVIGGLAVNTMHNELNRMGIRTAKSYDPTPDRTEPSVDAFGDGDFGICGNTFNQEACIQSLQYSIKDLDSMLNSGIRPKQRDYGALEFLPDMDKDARQPKPMFLLHNDKVYVRSKLSKVHRIGPDDYDQLQQKPKAWGYERIKGTAHLLYIVFKLRALPFYKTQLVPISQEEEIYILAQESSRREDRRPMPRPPCQLETVLEPQAVAYFERGGSPYLARENRAEERAKTNDVFLITDQLRW